MFATLQQARAVSSGVRPVDPVEVGECRRALREALAGGDCGAACLAERLSSLGFPALEPAWDLLWSAGSDEDLTREFERARIAGLDVLERLVLSSPPTASRRSLASRIVDEPRAEELLWICEHLGRHGTWRDVDLVLGLTRVDAEWLGLHPTVLEDRARSALTSILERDSTAFGALRSTVESAPAAFGATAVAALGESDGRRALETLTALIDLPRIDAAAVTSAIESVGRRALPPFDPYLLRRMREQSQAADPRQRAAALRACGALRDDEALPLLISGVSDDHSSVRSAATAALAEQTGLRFGNDPQRWASWYAGEVSWWESSAPSAIQRLGDEDLAVVVAALAEIVPHRLRRERLATAVAELLGHDSAELRRLACQSLEQLGGRTLAPAIVERLADVDDSVRASAHRCLEALFALGLPPDVEAWREHFESSRPSPR